MPTSLLTEIALDPIAAPDRPSFDDWATRVEDFFFLRESGDGKIVYCSPGYERIWGRTVESLYRDPLSWHQGVHPEDRERIIEASKSPDGFRDDHRVVRPTGEVRWVRSRTYPVFGPDGAVLRIVGFSEDITEWKRLEQQLLQSQKMDAVGRLAGGIAHDFNNLLTVINGYSAMLHDRADLPDSVREDIGNIHKAGQRAALLTNQLLTFSRQQPLKMTTVELGAAVKDMEPILRRLIRENVELNIVPATSEFFVRADPTQFEQVILNLVINARDAIVDKGTITLELSEEYFDNARALMHPGCTPGQYTMIAVTDTGRGMDAKTQERIFEPFFTTKQLGQGTGLGLAIVYGIVKQCNGTIWVYSEVGVGTTFRVYLPSTSTNASQAARVPACAMPEKDSGTVLLVEDEEQVRGIAAAVLKGRGYEVFSAANGQEALEIASTIATPLDLLVTDVIMPKMGGPELVDQLLPLHPAMRVLYISGYTENSIITSTAVHPAYLPKPFTPNLLAQKVSEILRQS